MMTTHQLKAARALLDWTQQDLAKASGLHLNVINNIERGATNPRQNTLEKLKKTLEDNGITFLGNRGVELAHQTLASRKFEGPGFIRHLLEDITQATKGTGGDVLAMIADIGTFAAHTGAAGDTFKKRVITRAMPGFYPKASEQFRVLPPEALEGADTLVYADRVAHIAWQAEEVLLTRGKPLAECQRAIFETLWQAGQQPIRPARARED